MKTVIVKMTADSFPAEKITELLHAAKLIKNISIEVTIFDCDVDLSKVAHVKTLKLEPREPFELEAHQVLWLPLGKALEQDPSRESSPCVPPLPGVAP